jgi:hypothetical protein
MNPKENRTPAVDYRRPPGYRSIASNRARLCRRSAALRTPRTPDGRFASKDHVPIPSSDVLSKQLTDVAPKDRSFLLLGQLQKLDRVHFYPRVLLRGI